MRFFIATECTDDYISIISNLFLRRESICSLYFYHFQGFTAMHLMPECSQRSSSDVLIEQKKSRFAAKCKNRSANQGGIRTSSLAHQGNKKQAGWGDLLLSSSSLQTKVENAHLRFAMFICLSFLGLGDREAT